MTDPRLLAPEEIAALREVATKNPRHEPFVKASLLATLDHIAALEERQTRALEYLDSDDVNLERVRVILRGEA